MNRIRKSYELEKLYYDYDYILIIRIKHGVIVQIK